MRNQELKDWKRVGKPWIKANKMSCGHQAAGYGKLHAFCINWQCQEFMKYRTLEAS